MATGSPFVSVTVPARVGGAMVKVPVNGAASDWPKMFVMLVAAVIA